jgi:hypothetical protein
MSADNGIYILKTPVRPGEGGGFEFRIAHVCAIENLLDIDPAAREAYICAVFGQSWVFHSRRNAELAAEAIYEDLIDSGRFTEYGGVATVEVSEPFPQKEKNQIAPTTQAQVAAAIKALREGLDTDTSIDPTEAKSFFDRALLFLARYFGFSRV